MVSINLEMRSRTLLDFVHETRNAERSLQVTQRVGERVRRHDLLHELQVGDAEVCADEGGGELPGVLDAVVLQPERDLLLPVAAL